MGIIAKNKHNKTLRIKKEFQYKENRGGDSSGDSEKEDQTSRVHTSKTTLKKVSRGATHDNDAGDGVYKTTDTTRKASQPLGTSSQIGGMGGEGGRTRHDSGSL